MRCMTSMREFEKEPNNENIDCSYCFSTLDVHHQKMDPSKLDRITAVNLIDICKHYFLLPKQDFRRRANIYKAISHQPINVQQAINIEANNAIEAGLTKHRKRGQDQEGSQMRLKRPRLASEDLLPAPTSQPLNFERNINFMAETNGVKCH